MAIRDDLIAMGINMDEVLAEFTASIHSDYFSNEQTKTHEFVIPDTTSEFYTMIMPARDLGVKALLNGVSGRLVSPDAIFSITRDMT